MCYNDSLLDGDAPSSEEPVQLIESSTFEQRTAADISDDVPKGDVLDMVVGKVTGTGTGGTGQQRGTEERV